MVLFCEVVKGAKSKPEVLKRQHLCGLLIAGKAPANAGRKSVAGRGLGYGKAGRHSALCGVKLCRLRYRFQKKLVSLAGYGTVPVWGWG